MNVTALQIRLVDASLLEALTQFFAEIRANGDDQFFHPHPFTADEAQRRAAYQGADLYYVLLQGVRILGYGMLRGWDEGYAIPSLGILIAKEARGTGLGALMMRFLHAAARCQGAEKICLKVYPDNAAAVALYQKLGYRFEAQESRQLVGYLDL
jgi:ribosomal protein S18 acetylase RimI-like enzyme